MKLFADRDRREMWEIRRWSAVPPRWPP